MPISDQRTPPVRMPLTIIGLGNEFLTDDGAGIRVVREVRRRLGDENTAFEELSVGGLPLLDYIIGFDRCMIVDAIVSGTFPPGTLYRFVQIAGSAPVKLTSSHQVDLTQVLGLGRLLGADLPRLLIVYGVEAGEVSTFHEDCTDAVAKAIPRLADVICEDARNVHTAPAAAGSWQVVQPVPTRFTVEHR
jgi:hydrogenase maturation protease